MTNGTDFMARESHGQQMGTPRPSVVEVLFPGWHRTLTYYNNLFDLHPGDFVYVDGKLEGKRGRVTEVNYNFKIRLADYQRVIALVDTEVHGRFFPADSHFVTFDQDALPQSKAALWYNAPLKPEDEYVSGSDETGFALADWRAMKVGASLFDRGRDYYLEDKVLYLCLDGKKGWAVVEGSRHYEVDFRYKKGKIRALTCGCYCAGVCKHEVAVILQLQDLLEQIQEHYAEEYTRTGYFAAICKSELFRLAVPTRPGAGFTL